MTHFEAPAGQAEHDRLWTALQAAQRHRHHAAGLAARLNRISDEALVLARDAKTELNDGNTEAAWSLIDRAIRTLTGDQR